VSANKHARKALSITTLPADDVALTLSGERFRLKLNGIATAADVQPTDVVKVVGKLVRPKKGCTGDTTVDVTKVSFSREAPAPAQS
jgi:hypothetical protein